MASSLPSNPLLDTAALDSKVAEMAEALAGRVQDPTNCALIGIRTRGVTLARRLQEHLRSQKGWELPLGVLDITLYRDDLSQMSEHPLVQSTEIEFDIQGKLIFLIDDVLYTGRTIRSALDALLEFGRPQRIMLGVLIDRGLREFPIQPDVAAMTLETEQEETVRVCFAEDDGQDCVIIEQRPAA